MLLDTNVIIYAGGEHAPVLGLTDEVASRR